MPHILVTQHIPENTRILPEGQLPSREKYEEARANGYELRYVLCPRDTQSNTTEEPGKDTKKLVTESMSINHFIDYDEFVAYAEELRTRYGE